MGMILRLFVTVAGAILGSTLMAVLGAIRRPAALPVQAKVFLLALQHAIDLFAIGQVFIADAVAR